MGCKAESERWRYTNKWTKTEAKGFIATGSVAYISKSKKTAASLCVGWANRSGCCSIDTYNQQTLHVDKIHPEVYFTEVDSNASKYLLKKIYITIITATSQLLNQSHTKKSKIRQKNSRNLICTTTLSNLSQFLTQIVPKKFITFQLYINVYYVRNQLRLKCCAG